MQITRAILQMLVYHNTTEDSLHDVRYNCWDNSFAARDDLYPEAAYATLPYYCTSKKSSAIPTPDEVLYNQASAYFKAAKYDSAQLFYDSLVV